jgi:hypothetical protein
VFQKQFPGRVAVDSASTEAGVAGSGGSERDEEEAA